MNFNEMICKMVRAEMTAEEVRDIVISRKKAEVWCNDFDAEIGFDSTEPAMRGEITIQEFYKAHITVSYMLHASIAEEYARKEQEKAALVEATTSCARCGMAVESALLMASNTSGSVCPDCYYNEDGE